MVSLVFSAPPGMSLVAQCLLHLIAIGTLEFYLGLGSLSTQG